MANPKNSKFEPGILPERLFYKLSDAARKLGCNEDDILHFAATSGLKLSVFLDELSDDFLPLHLNAYKDVVGQSILDEKWYVGGLSSHIGRNGAAEPGVFRFRELLGFFYIAPRSLFNIEFNSDVVSIETPYLASHANHDSDNADEEREGFYITAPSGFITVGRSNLCIMARDLEQISLHPKMPFLSSRSAEEAPKTRALKQLLITQCIELLPVFQEGDIEKLKTSVILHTLEAYAAKQAKKFHKFDKETFAEYIGKK